MPSRSRSPRRRHASRSPDARCRERRHRSRSASPARQPRGSPSYRESRRSPPRFDDQRHDHDDRHRCRSRQLPVATAAETGRLHAAHEGGSELDGVLSSQHSIASYILVYNHCKVTSCQDDRLRSTATTRLMPRRGGGRGGPGDGYGGRIQQLHPPPPPRSFTARGSYGGGRGGGGGGGANGHPNGYDDDDFGIVATDMSDL